MTDKKRDTKADVAKRRQAKTKPLLAEVKPGHLVEPLSKNAFGMMMEIIDNSSMRGADAGKIILLKQELVRVAGLKPAPLEL